MISLKFRNVIIIVFLQRYGDSYFASDTWDDYTCRNYKQYRSFGRMVFDVRISIRRATWENQSSYIRSLDGDSPRTEVEMEIYEADSRINAAAYRTAFRAMGRAFFRSGNRSCPHFTINVVFFRLLRCVPFADSMVARLLVHIAKNKYICTLRFSTAAISGHRCAKVKCHAWSMERAV